MPSCPKCGSTDTVTQNARAHVCVPCCCYWLTDTMLNDAHTTQLRGTLIVDADVRKRLGHCVRFDLDCAGARRGRILRERQEKTP